MFVRLSTGGQLLAVQAFPGEEDCVLTVVVENRAYYLFVKGEKIMGVIPVACGASKYFLAPKVAIEELGARVAFYNVNGRAISTEFFALIMIENAYQDAELPSVEDIYKRFVSEAHSETKLAVSASAATGLGRDGRQVRLNMF